MLVKKTIMKKVQFLLAFFSQLAIASCCFCDEEKVKAEPEKPIFTFAVAGHVYGNAETFTSSIYPPFLKKLKEDDLERNFNFLFLTGDVVPLSNDSNWNTVTEELNELSMSWVIAPGNHDLGLDYLPVCEAMQKSGGLGGPYQFMEFGRNPVLVLNTSNPGWTLDEQQLQLLSSYLKTFEKDSIDNIFVFTHQLWWQNNPPKEFQLDSIKPNSYAAMVGSSTFWSDAFPLFDSLENEIYFFAGDLGAHHSIESYYEDHYKNFHFYGSGMGGGIKDNYLIVSVYENGAVEIEHINF